ncbi:MAG TPA: L,D-transpeptidase family protein [Roseiarcus sp.]|nr:L,D-transpeptidase family protein [Roseiarcus sp.]
MRCGPQAIGLVWLLASMVGSPASSAPSRVIDPLAAIKSVPEPELPPDLGEAPAATISQSPPPAVQRATPAAIAPLASERSDPEVGAPPLPPGASPNDIADAIEALPPADGKRSAVSALPNWRASRDALSAFYSGRAYAAVWTDAAGYNAAGKATIARLKRADEDGLDLSGLSIPAPGVQMKDPAALAKAEVALAEAILAYAFQASGGRIDPLRISPMITAKAAVVDPARALSAVAASTDPGAALADFNPPQKGYRELREELTLVRASLGAIGRSADGADAAGSLRSGDPRALARLPFEADAKARRSALRAQTADLALSSEDADLGRLAPPASPSRALEASILANMEMWRWEPRDMGEQRIEVNVADFTLRVLHGEDTLLSTRIIVGKPDWQTPIFSNVMRYILVNPSWRVPPSIIRKEMLPKLADDPDYLTRQGFEVTQKGDTIEVRQPPGERNALGHIAFMFPNEHSVYLHDTPSRELFMASRRAFSHGCVRVDQPMRLAELVMGGNWSEQRLRSLIGETERTIFLPRPVPIHIEYFTAFVDEAGALQTRDDVYGHMQRVESALGLLGKS